MDKMESRGVVLVVEDSKPERKILQKILENEGYRVLQVSDGRSALDILTEEIPDVVLLDVIMPGPDGFEVCKLIKSNKRTAHIPVLFVTIVTDAEAKIKGFKVGGADYITKPYNPEEIIARVNMQLRLKAANEIIQDHSNKLEKMLEERTKDLIRSERQAVVGQFVQGIVHNMRNPLTSVLGYAQLIQKDLNKFIKIIKEHYPEILKENKLMISETMKRVDNLERAAMRITEMINSMMRKICSDHSNEFEIIDLNDIIHQEMNFFEINLWCKYNVKKIISISEKPLLIYAVPSMITQVFENLLQNSLDAMYNTPSPTLVVSSGQKDDIVWFFVADNGPGISEEIMPQIFDPFFTTKPKIVHSYDNKPIGTGLGLYICQDMLNLHQGKIKVESSLEEGTTFYVEFPLANNI